MNASDELPEKPPRIAWSTSITSSGIAPGRPYKQLPNNISPRTKVSAKLANQLKAAESFTVEKVPEETENSDLDNWDPASLDHQSPSFNSYQEGGLGSVMLNCTESGTKTVNLYVGQVPSSLNKEALRKLFSRAGKPNRVFLNNPKTGHSYTFGFVEFSTIREASTAIQLLNGFDMGNNTKLVVKISETPEQRQSRISKPKDVDSSNPSLFEEADSMIDDTHTNPLLPRYKSTSLASPDKPRPTLGGMLGTPLSPAEGATGLNALSSSGEIEFSTKMNTNPSVNDSKESGNKLPCHLCNTLTFERCSQCKTPYCSIDCQTTDWPKHQTECKLIQSGSIVSDNIAGACTPPQNTSNTLLDESGDSFDDLYADQDDKYKTLCNEIQFPDETQSEHIDDDIPTTSATQHSVPGTLDSEVFERPFVSDRSKEPEGVTLQEIFSQFRLVSDSESLPSLPLDFESMPKEFPMIVSYFMDAMRFSAIPASSETFQAFQKIEEFGNQSDHSPEYSFNPGTICGYKDKTGAFYRIKIVHPPSKTVELYDTGFRPKLPFTNLVKLSDEIASIPSLYKPCSFYNVFLNSEVPGGSKFFKELVNLNPIRVDLKNKPFKSPLKLLFFGRVFDFQRTVNIYDKMAATPFCSRSGINQKPALIQQEPLLLNAASHSSSTPKQQFSDARIYKPVKMAREVPFHCPPINVTLTIVPKVVLNPNLIWAQVMHSNFSFFHNMQADINALSQASVASSYTPSVGEMVIVKFTAVQAYYRAEVLCVNHDETVDVQFVDLGNRETVSIEQLHYIKPQFLTLPKQALRFSLAGLGPSNTTKTWKDAPGILLKDKILNRRVQVNILTFSKDTYEVEMYDLDDPSLTINNILVQKGLASVDVRRLATPTHPLTPTANISGVSVSSLASPPPLGMSVNESPLPSLYVYPKKSSDALPSLSQSHDVTTPPVKADISSPHQQMALLSIDKKSSDALLSLSQSHDVTTPPVKANISSPRQPKALLIDYASSTSSVSSDLVYSGANTPQSLSARTKSNVRISSIELEEGKTFPVTVTHVASPYDFWVQLITKPAVKKLMSLYDKIKRSVLVPATSLSAGSLCLCRFSEDNQVHRARIHSLEDGKALVTYIDYGNSETVSLDCLYSIGSDLVSFNQLATSCTVNSLLNPQGKSCEWNKKAVDYFKHKTLDNEIEMTVVRCMGRKHIVDVVVQTDQGKKQVLDLFIENKLGLTAGRKNDSSRPPKSILIPSPQKSRSSSSPQKPISSFERNLSDRSRNFPKNDHSPKLPKQMSPAKLPVAYPKVAEMKVVEFNGEMDVMVTEVYSPDSIVVQPASSENAECLDQISTRLNSLTPPSVPTDVPGVGSLCCVVFSEDGLWYRAEVLKQTPSGVEMNFIDFGNTEVVQLECIAQCPKDVVGMPVCAVKCSLSGLCPIPPNTEWPAQVSTYLKTVCSDQLLKAKVLDRGSVATNIRLFHGDLDIAASLIEKKLAIADTGSKLANISDIPQSILPSDIFQVVTGNIESPSELYIQLATEENAQLLDKVSSGLNDQFSSSPPPPLKSPPAKGSLCAAKFSDGVWYRAEVLTSFPTSCEVRFIDFGNKDRVDIKNMAVCPEEFLSVPCFAIRCGLFGIESPNMDKTFWPNKAIEQTMLLMSDKILTAQIVPCNNAFPLMRLKDSSTGVDIGLDLVNKGLAVSIEKMPPPRKQNVVSPQKRNVVSLPSASTLKKVELPTSGVFQVLVSECVSPSELYIQVASTELLMELHHISEQLNSKFSPSIPQCHVIKTPPTKGSLCIAKFSDGEWYRVEVLGCFSTSCEVNFVDYGNKDTVEVDCLAVCPEEFLTAPRFAVQCSLAGVECPNPNETWSKEAIAHLKKATADKLLKAKVASAHPVSGIPVIKLKDPATGKNSGDVNSELIKLGYALSPAVSSPITQTKKPEERNQSAYYQANASSVHQPTASSKQPNIPVKASPTSKPTPKLASMSSPTPKQPTLPMAANLIKCDLPSGLFQVVISEVVSPQEMYAQLATTEIATILEKLSDGLNDKLSNSFVPLNARVPPAKGSLCAAKFSDGVWYRAEVLSSFPTSCEVRFIDFGNKDAVDIKNMAICPEEFLSVPCLTVCCGLAGIESSHSEWSNESIGYLKNVISDKLLQGEVIEPGTVPLLMLCDPNGTPDVSLAMIEKGFAVDVTNVPSVVPPCKTLSLPADAFKLIVSEVVSPDELYVQLATEENAQLLDKVSSGLNDQFSSSPPPPLKSPPAKGSLCAAKFSDGVWYRAEVLTSSPTSCEVRFIDFGNKDRVDLKNMAVCPEEFIAIPCFSVCCALDSVVSPSDDPSSWPDESIAGLKQLICDQLMKAKVVRKDVVPVIKIKREDNVGKGDISFQMIQRGWAMDPRMVAEF